MSKAFLKKYKEVSSEDELTELNLSKKYIPDIDADVLNGWGQLRIVIKVENLSVEQHKKLR
ncbi:FMN-dependent NADH-azoreductase [Neobacillus cucumis]|nr:hypothetical protein [Neobacillus cucumis]MBM7652536.1 FMN-dependent NADH-azoreductase [Neobacillus cucumis]